MKTLRVATLQLNPRIGAIAENIKKANTILAQSFPTSPTITDKPDLLILPELGLTGYNFASAAHIKPFLESPSHLGPTLTWAKEVSLKYGCFTVLGYPEFSSPDSKIYNSAIVFDKDGKIVDNYRKSFLYETDEKWGAAEGPGFKTFQLMDGVKASIGICMDLNPYKFEAPFQKFEFSNYCHSNDANLIICPNAWLHGESPSTNEELDPVEKEDLKERLAKKVEEIQNKMFAIDKDGSDITDYELSKNFLSLAKPDYGTINYWILRFFPFVHHFWGPNNLPHKTTVVLTNRSGIEDDILYCGSSSIFQFYGKERSGSFDFETTYFDNFNVRVLGALGKGNEGILIRNVEL